MPRASTIPLSYLGDDGKRHKAKVVSSPMRQRNVEPGTSYNGITVQRKYRDAAQNTRAIYVVACNTCQHVMHLKATNLHNANFACPQCEGKLRIHKPDVQDNAPFKVDALSYLVRTKHEQLDGYRFFSVWHAECCCGRKFFVRGDKVETGSLAGCGQCAPSMLFRAKHGLR